MSIFDNSQQNSTTKGYETMFGLDLVELYRGHQWVSILDIVLAVVYLVVLLVCAATIMGFKNNNK